MMGMEFENVKDQDKMELVHVNTTAARKHVDGIEQAIQYGSRGAGHRNKPSLHLSLGSRGPDIVTSRPRIYLWEDEGRTS